MRSLDLVHVLAGPYPTRQGSQVYVRGMVRALARRGHRVTLLCYGHADGPAIGRDGGVRVLRVPVPPGYGNLRAGPDWVKPALDALLAARLLPLARRADVLHAHNYEAPLAAYLARAATGTPVVYNAHTVLEEELPTYFSPRWRPLARGLGRFLDAQVPRRADAGIALSPHGLESLRRLGVRRAVLAPPGVELAELRGADPERGRRMARLDGRPWVVYAGNPDAYQELDVLYRAVARLDEPGLLLLSASPLDAELARCRALGIPERRLRALRLRSWPELRDAMAAADLAAVPRSVVAGFPIKLLNLLGLGLPTAVARSAAPPVPGAVPFADGDDGDLARVLGELAASPERRRELGARAREAVAREWSWDARVRRVEALYAELLGLGGEAAWAA